MSAQQLLFAIGLLVCVALLVHQAIGARQQARLAWWWRGRVARGRLAWARLRLRLQRSRKQRQEKSKADESLDPAEAKRRAALEAADLIERARRGNGAGDGKVVRPPRFGDRRKDLH